jgi:hypothetical protein
MLDQYQESGEFLDLLSVDAWQALQAPVRHALAGADAGAPAWTWARAADVASRS